MTAYRTIEVDGTEIFYRERGERTSPTLLLLHGFPSSSAQYEHLMRRLADRYHVVAPDYPFVIFEVSGKVAAHAWRRQPPGRAEPALERLPDSWARPGDRLEQREQLQVLSVAIGELTERQRQVFVAIALNDVPIDMLAMQLDTNRNAIYKNLFDARRTLRARMAAAGHPLTEKDAA